MPPFVRTLRFRPDRYTLLLAVLGALGTALVLAREITYGVILHWDSINYIAIARNLLAGKGFLQLAGAPYWPPLYPLLLATASLNVFDPYAIAGPLNAIAFGLTIFVTGRWLRRRLTSRFLALWGCLAVMWAVPVGAIAAWALSESLFILLVMLSLIRVDAFLRDGRLALLMQAGVLTALVLVTRVIGIVLPIAVAPLLLGQRHASLGQNLKRLIAYEAIAGSLLGLWIGRNFLIFRVPIGHWGDIRSRSAVSLQRPWTETAQAFLDTMAEWAFAALRWEGFGVRIGIGLVLSALVLAVGYCFVTQFQPKERQGHGLSFCLFGAFVLTYLIGSALWFLMLSTSDEAEQIERYLLPVYIPLVCAAMLALDKSLFRVRCGQARRHRQLRRGLTVFAASMLVAWLAFQVPLHARAIVLANASGVPRSYSNARLAYSEVLRYLRATDVEGPVASNAFHVVYMYTDIDQDALTPVASDLLDVERWIAEVPEGAFLVWFRHDSWTRGFSFSEADLRQVPGLELQADLANGLVFTVNQTSTDPETYAQTLLSLYEDIVSNPARVRAVFDVYLLDQAVAYVKAPCSVEDVQARFQMHVRPVSVADLPAARQSLGFDNWDSDYVQRGARFDDKCLVIIPRPVYPMREIAVGQYDGNQTLLWSETISLPFVDPRTDDLRAAYETVASGPALHRALFTVYRHGASLVYANAACNPAAIEARFFLHVYPTRTGALPRNRRRYGFDNLDFDFDQHGVRFEETCVAVVPLPAYDIDRIKTGQWIRDEGQVWVAEFPFPERPP